MTLTKEKIRKNKETTQIKFNMNFRMNKLEKIKLDGIAKDLEISTSELLRIIVEDFIKKQKSSGGKTARK